jgi:hypothetical protein
MIDGIRDGTNGEGGYLATECTRADGHDEEDVDLCARVRIWGVDQFQGDFIAASDLRMNSGEENVNGNKGKKRESVRPTIRPRVDIGAGGQWQESWKQR